MIEIFSQISIPPMPKSPGHISFKISAFPTYIIPPFGLSSFNLFLIFIGSIGFDLLIGDPKFITHPVQIIGIYIKKTTNFFLFRFSENKKILFWGGLFIALSTISISFFVGIIIRCLRAISEELNVQVDG